MEKLRATPKDVAIGAACIVGPVTSLAAVGDAIRTVSKPADNAHHDLYRVVVPYTQAAGIHLSTLQEQDIYSDLESQYFQENGGPLRLGIDGAVAAAGIVVPVLLLVGVRRAGNFLREVLAKGTSPAEQAR